MTQTRTVEQQTAPEETNKAQITLNMLRQWGACQGGKSWFSAKSPQGAEYGETMTALYADKKYGDARWLARNVFDKAFSKEIVISDVNSLIALTKDVEGAEDNSGDDAQIGSSGYGARIEAIGENVVVSCSGKSAKVKIGKGGAACLNWHDGKRAHFVAIYEGEDGIKAGAWYALDSNGAVYEVEAT